MAAASLPALVGIRPSCLPRTEPALKGDAIMPAHVAKQLAALLARSASSTCLAWSHPSRPCPLPRPSLQGCHGCTGPEPLLLPPHDHGEGRAWSRGHLVNTGEPRQAGKLRPGLAAHSSSCRRLLASQPCLPLGARPHYPGRCANPPPVRRRMLTSSRSCSTTTRWSGHRRSRQPAAPPRASRGRSPGRPQPLMTLYTSADFESWRLTVAVLTDE